MGHAFERKGGAEKRVEEGWLNCSKNATSDIGSVCGTKQIREWAASTAPHRQGAESREGTDS